ncbi:MAG: ATP-dependent Clp protease proteolytic subunit [Verrucomicrobiota bacterium]
MKSSMPNNIVTTAILIVILGTYFFISQLIAVWGSFFVISQNQEPFEFDYESLSDAFIDAGFEPTSHPEDTRLLEKRILIVNTDINAVSARSLIRKLLLLDRQNSKLPIDLYLRTEGGWEADIFSMIDTMRSIKAPVNIHGIGEVHSSGSMLLAAATGRRVVYPHTILGFHTLGVDEDPIFENRYINFWKAHAKLPEKWLERDDDEMIYFSPQEALDYGVADTIYTNEPSGSK